VSHDTYARVLVFGLVCAVVGLAIDRRTKIFWLELRDIFVTVVVLVRIKDLAREPHTKHTILRVHGR